MHRCKDEGISEDKLEAIYAKETNPIMDLNYTLDSQPQETKGYQFEVKEINENDDQNVAIIKGYGSTFGNVDLGNDIVEKGAFEKTLREKGGKVFFLKDHRYDMDNQLGVATLKEDSKGLYGEFELNLETPQGQMAYAQAKQAKRHGIPLGMSIGYDIVKADYDSSNDVRRLKELKLHEVSLTMFPMNTEAGMTDVKSTKESLSKHIERLEQYLAQVKEKVDSLPSDEPGDHSGDEAESEQELKGLLTELKSANKQKENDE